MLEKVPECDKSFLDFTPNRLSKSIFLNPVSENEVIHVCLSLNNSNSTGIDDRNTTVIKKIIYTISSPLTYIFNLSLATGKVPSKLKIAKVIPLFKKGDCQSVANYRPISILPCFSKILEKCVHKRIDNFLSLNNLLCTNQFGLRPNHGTVHALIDLTDRIINSPTESKHVMGVCIDLSKAFDTLDHFHSLFQITAIWYPR